MWKDTATGTRPPKARRLRRLYIINIHNVLETKAHTGCRRDCKLKIAK
jgi:hypothetical protein